MQAAWTNHRGTEDAVTLYILRSEHEGNDVQNLYDVKPEKSHLRYPPLSHWQDFQDTHGPGRLVVDRMTVRIETTNHGEDTE